MCFFLLLLLLCLLLAGRNVDVMAGTQVALLVHKVALRMEPTDTKQRAGRVSVSENMVEQGHHASTRQKVSGLQYWEERTVSLVSITVVLTLC